MVRFEEDKLVIEIPSYKSSGALENWQNLHAALCDLLYYVKSDSICDETFYNISQLMQSLMPDWEDAKKMV